MRRQLLLAAATTTCLGLGACVVTSDADDVPLGEIIEGEELVIRPGGTDYPGQLVVLLPEALQSTDPATFAPVVLTAGGQTMTIGVPLSLAVGNTQLWTYWSGGSASYMSTLAIASNQLTTERLSAFRFTAPTETVTGINGMARSGGAGQGLLDSINGSSPVSLPSNYLARTALRPAGVYRFSWGAFDGVEVPINANQLKTVDLADLSTRRAIRIVAPPQREMPNCNTNPYTLRAIRDGTDQRQMTLAPGESVLVGEASWHQAGRASYLLNTPGMHSSGSGVSFTLQMPTQVGQLTEYRLGRLDIDDVAVDTPDGVRLVRGSFRVNRLWTPTNGTEQEAEEITNCQTHTGLDVMPGRYRIRVAYQTVESGTKTIIIDVTVPPGG